MDNGAFLGSLALPLLFGLVIGLVVALPLVLSAVVGGLSHVIGALVRASVDAVRARDRTRGSAPSPPE